MNLKLVTPAALSPVTLTEAKSYLRVDADDDDARIENLIKAVTRKAEEFTRRAFITQTWEIAFDKAPCEIDQGRYSPISRSLFSPIEIPRPPLQSIVSIKSYDQDGTEAVFDLNNIWVDTRSTPGRIALKEGVEWPTELRSIDSIVIQFTAGYGLKPENVDDGIREGILRGVATLYAAREDAIIGIVAAKLPEGARELLHPYKVFRL